MVSILEKAVKVQLGWNPLGDSIQKRYVLRSISEVTAERDKLLETGFPSEEQVKANWGDVFKEPRIEYVVETKQFVGCTETRFCRVFKRERERERLMNRNN